MNNPRSDLVFWSQRWADVRRYQKRTGGCGNLTAMNYMLFLCEVFSFLFEERMKANGKILE